MKIKFEIYHSPDWFRNFARVELWDEYKLRLGQHREQHKDFTFPSDLLDWAVKFYTEKGLTAWGEKNTVFLELDLDEPEWIMRMLKNQGQA